MVFTVWYGIQIGFDCNTAFRFNALSEAGTAAVARALIHTTGLRTLSLWCVHLFNFKAGFSGR